MDGGKKKKSFSNHDSITNSASLKKETVKSETALVRVPQTSQNLVISSRCCCAEDGKEIQEKLYRKCTIIVQLILLFGGVLLALVVVVCLISL